MAAKPTYRSETDVSSRSVVVGETTSITTTFTNTNNTAYDGRVVIQLFDGRNPSPVASSDALKTIPANGSTSFTFNYSPQPMAAGKEYNIGVGVFAANPQWEPNLYWEWTPLKITVSTDSLFGDTADPHATAATKATYADLWAAPSRDKLRLIIGQALRGWDSDHPIDEPVTALTDAGLPAPALLEVDLTDFDAEHERELYELLRRHAGAGGLLGFSFHADNPFTGGGVYDRRNVDLPQLINPADPQTPAARRWSSELDRIANVMESFPTAVVLFRPLHESNGNWFWWGQADPDEFRAVWQGMFSYLTMTKGLHNLLWVYSANRYLGDEWSDPTRLYPGDAVVDLVGLDIYDDDLATTEPGYEAMVALGKPFGITEYGAANWPTEHNGAVELPNDKVIRIIKRDYPQTVLATAWYSQDGNNWQISDKPHPEALLRDRWAITLAPQRRVPPQRGRPRPKPYSREQDGHQGPSAGYAVTRTNLFDPDKKLVAMQLVSSAENSTLDWQGQYGYIEDIGDGRGYTGGIIGFTSGTHDMLEVVKYYTELSPGNILAKYIPALNRVDGSASHEGLDPYFVTDWNTAAADPLFRLAQDHERDQMYFNPAVRQAIADGLGPLGQFMYYDAVVMHGPGSGFEGIRADATRKAKVPAKGGSEAAYLSVFLDVRKRAMLAETAHSNTDRVDKEQRKFLRERNLDLNPPLSWSTYGDQYTIK